MINKNKCRVRSSLKRRSSTQRLQYDHLELRNLLAPVVGDDSFVGVGNSQVELNATGDFQEAPSVKVVGSLFDNDDAGVTLDSFDAVSDLNGSVSVAADGSFVYQPAVGVTNTTDSFTYTVSDGVETATANVSIELRGMVWFVDTSAASGDGTSSNPFSTFSALDGEMGVGDVDSPNDTIYVAFGSNALTDSLELEEGQRLVGEGVELVENGLTLNPAGTAPTIDIGTQAIELAQNNEISGLKIEAQDVGIVGENVSSLNIFDIVVSAGSIGLRVEATENVDLSIVRSSFSDASDSGVHVSTTGQLNSTIQENTFESSEYGFVAEFQQVGHQLVENNQFTSIGDIGLWLNGENDQREVFSFEVSSNQFDGVNGSGIYIQGANALDGNWVRSRLVDNQVGGPSYYRSTGIRVHGGFEFHTGDISGNEVEGRLVGQAYADSFFNNLEVDQWTSESGLSFNGSGDIKINRLTIRSAEQASTTPVSFSAVGNRAHTSQLNLEIGEFDFSSRARDRIDSTRFLNGVWISSIGQLKIGSGNFQSDGQPISISKVADADIQWNNIRITDELPIWKFISAVEFSELDGNVSIGDINVKRDLRQLDLQRDERRYEIILEDANITVNGSVSVDTLEGNFSSFHDEFLGAPGLLVEPGISTVPNTITFNGDLDVRTIQNEGINLGIGRTVFNGHVYTFTDGHDINRLTQRPTGILAENYLRQTELEFRGGVDAKAVGYATAINVQGVVLTMVGENNFSVDGSLALFLFGVQPGEEGIHLNEITAPNSKMYLGTFNYDVEGPLPSIIVDGAAKVRILDFDSRGSSGGEVTFRDPQSIIYSGLIAQGAAPGTHFTFNGRIESTDPETYAIEFTNRTSYLGSKFDFNGPVSSDAEKGILIQNLFDSDEDAGFVTVNFNDDVRIGQENPTAAGLFVGDYAKVNFHSQLFVSSIGPDPAIHLSGSHGSLYLSSFTARSTGDVLIAEDFGSITSDSGLIAAVGNDGNPAGQAIGVKNTRLNLVLDQVFADDGTGPAIELLQTTGRFRIEGREENGVVTGGTIDGRSNAAILIEEAENILLHDLAITRSVNDGIRLKDVKGFQFVRSSLTDSGSNASDNALEIENATGFYRILDSTIENTHGLHDVVVTNRGNAVLDSLVIRRSQFGGRSLNGGKSLLFSAYARSEMSVIVASSTFLDNNGDHVLARTNGFSKLEFSANNNLVKDFHRGFGFQKRGASELSFNLRRNQFIGRDDLSSQFAVYALGMSNHYGSGEIKGTISHHRGNTAGISRTQGIRLQLLGTTLPDGRQIRANGSFEIHDNLIESYRGYAAINATVDGADSLLNLRATRNVFLNPLVGNATSIRVVAGFSSPNQSLLANVTLKENNAIAGPGNRAAGYQLVQRNDSTLNLTAPVGNPQIGFTFINDDGGVVTSTGVSGNNNQNRNGRDVIALGAINIIEES